MTTIQPQPPVGGLDANAEAIAAWDGPLFERFVQFRHVLTTGLGVHGEHALELYPPQSGQRVLDIGCGFGDTTLRIAELVGAEGSAVGLDAAPSFIESARGEAAAAKLANVRFEVADAQSRVPDGPFELAFSRFGTMFFANPVVALRNVRGSLAPGGRLVMVVWRRRLDNDWLYRGQTIVEGMVARPDEYDEPTCGPGPFSMADADTVSDVLHAAGYEGITLHRFDHEIVIGTSLEEAIDLVMALGPAGELLRLQGDRAAHLHGPVREALREGMADMVGADGVRAAASTWTVSAVPA